MPVLISAARPLPHPSRVFIVVYRSTITTESWPGLFRPSTSCVLQARKKDVDARDKRGHDDGEVISFSLERALAVHPTSSKSVDRRSRKADVSMTSTSPT